VEKNIIIIGAGHSGGIVASEIRKNNKKVSITIFGEESYFPYQRPQLSKSFIKGEIEEKSLFLKSKDFYKKNNIDVITDTKIIEINKNKKIVTSEKGDKYTYDFLVIATGSKLTKLNLECSDSNIHYLRTIKESLRIKDQIDQNKKLVIVGAGYIGLEIACFARSRGSKTKVIEQYRQLMARSVSKEISEFFYNKHLNNSVEFCFEKTVRNIEDHKGRKQVILDDNEIIDADEVVIGIGIKPNIELALAAGIKCSDGIEVNEYGQTSDKSIYATGDCTFHFNSIYKKRIRLESVQNAVEQSKIVALAVLGNKKQYDSVPWFWSEQYDARLQIAGIRDKYDQSIETGSFSEEKFSYLYLKNNKLIAVESINDSKTFLKAKKLIGSKENYKIDHLLK
tara:strand:+ start:165 stop:1349 length:1185 start_codon:yes stop_codon:yes gene_type:complete